MISDTVVEVRDIPTPVGPVATESPGEIDVFGDNNQLAAIQNVALEFELYQGDTVFKPPEYEFRFTPVFNANYVKLEEINGVNVDPRDGRTRADNFVGIQAAFVDKHLRNVSDRFDFDSIRVGIQPFSSDFRGFLFQDNQLGVRLFGNRRNNVIQYNLAWFRRIEKDTNSGLNDLGQPLRDDDIFIANLYWQDLPVQRLHVTNPSCLQPQRRGPRKPIRQERFHRASRVVWPGAPAQLRRWLRRLQRRRPLRPTQSDDLHCITRSDRKTDPYSSTSIPISVRCLRLRNCRSTSIGSVRGCRFSMAVATMIRSTTNRRDSTRSSRIRSSPAPIRATGFARQFR